MITYKHTWARKGCTIPISLRISPCVAQLFKPVLESTAPESLLEFRLCTRHQLPFQPELILQGCSYSWLTLSGRLVCVLSPTLIQQGVDCVGGQLCSTHAHSYGDLPQTELELRCPMYLSSAWLHTKTVSKVLYQWPQLCSQ